MCIIANASIQILWEKKRVQFNKQGVYKGKSTWNNEKQLISDCISSVSGSWFTAKIVTSFNKFFTVLLRMLSLLTLKPNVEARFINPLKQSDCNNMDTKAKWEVFFLGKFSILSHYLTRKCIVTAHLFHGKIVDLTRNLASVKYTYRK